MNARLKTLNELRDALTEQEDLAVRLLSGGVPLTAEPGKESVADTLGISAREASGLLQSAKRKARGFLPRDASPERIRRLLWWATPPSHYLTGVAAVNLDDPAAVVSACRDFVYPQGGKSFLAIYPGGTPADEDLPVTDFSAIARLAQGVLHNLHEHGGLSWDQIDAMNRHLEKVIPTLEVTPSLPPGTKSLSLNEALAEARKSGGIVPAGSIEEGVCYEAEAEQIEVFTLGIVCSLRDVIREEANGEKRVNRCASCGRLFILRRSDQRWCSDRCLSRAANRRFRERKEKPKVS